MTLNGIPDRGTPRHVTLTPDTVEVIDLERDWPAVEVLAMDGQVTMTVDGDAPTTDSGHVVMSGGAVAVRSGARSAGEGATTRVQVLGSPGSAPKVVVTGLR